MARKASKRPLQQLFFWAPRILAIAFAGFLSLFAADVFGEGHGFWQTVLALLIHLIPTWLVLIVLAIAWRWQRIGAALFIILGLCYALLCPMALNHPNWILGISGPLFLLGVLFFLDGQFCKKRPQANSESNTI